MMVSNQDIHCLTGFRFGFCFFLFSHGVTHQPQMSQVLSRFYDWVLYPVQSVITVDILLIWIY